MIISVLKLILANRYTLKDQPVNLILILISVFIVKLLKEKGHKSKAFRILCMMIIILTLIGLLAHLMQTSIDSTDKFSFKGAGTVYRRRYTMYKELPKELHLTESDLKRRKLNEILDKILIELDSKNETLSKSKQKQSSNQTHLKKASNNEIKSVETGQNKEFRVLSSFDCNGSIPSAFLNYVSNTFTSEYRRSYADFNPKDTSIQFSLDKITPELRTMNNFTQSFPNLTDVRINCVLGQPCQTLFKYDKQRGLDKQYPKENIFSGADKILPRENIFYCCPPVDYFTSQTVTKECNEAKTIIEKSAFRQSKKPFLLERVNS